MKASELRIGNYINIHNTITCMELNDFHFSSSFIEPVPLTEEWLSKLGFEKKYSNYIIKAGDYFHSIKKDGKKWIYSYDESDACCYELRRIKYVHQLQNLYFALNDKEL
jgi:hypothetical protein